MSSARVMAKFKKLNDVSLLSDAFLLVSVGNPKHEGNNLRATLGLFNLYHAKNKSFKQLDILIAGTLQRHNFWAFSANLNDDELKKLLADVPADVDIEQFAIIMAKVFYDEAKKVECKYIADNWNIYCHPALNIFLNLIYWNQELSEMKPGES
jgi:hypothetical protein